MTDFPSIMEAAEDDLLEVRLPAGLTAIARVVGKDCTDSGALILRIEPAEAKYQRTR